MPLDQVVRLCAFSNRRWGIRVFGVSLLAVAAVAAASLLWKRRQEQLTTWFEPEEEDHRLEDLRVAGL
jgi:hypothetical protein